MMKIRTARSFVSLTLVLVVASVSFRGHAQSASQSQEMLCHIPDATEKHDHQAMMTNNKGVVAMAQLPQDPGKDPDQSYDTPTHRYSPGDGCSSVNPNAPNKKRDGVNPNTVGCKCAKKCVDGRTEEDRTKDKNDVYECRNACHTNRCTCPDPCKT